jgi:hypothetical protein
MIANLLFSGKIYSENRIKFNNFLHIYRPAVQEVSRSNPVGQALDFLHLEGLHFSRPSQISILRLNHK